jgi:ABC-2 type transport system permease protein
MRNILAIARKELVLYFTTPWAWLVLTAMAFFGSVSFISLVGVFKQVHELAQAFTWAKAPPEWSAFKNLTDGVVVQLWGVQIIVTILAGPVLSMGLFSEEYRRKTFELLMTTPVRPSEIVLGKYLGGVGMVLTTLSITIVYPIILSIFGASESGTALEWSTVLLGYVGLLMLGATAVALCMFISSLTESQLVAAFTGISVLLVWLLIGSATRNIPEPFRSAITYLSIDAQLQNLLKGLFDPKPIVFFASVIAFFLLLTHRAVEAKRWT